MERAYTATQASNCPTSIQHRTCKESFISQFIFQQMLFNIFDQKACVQTSLVEAILDGGQRRINALGVGDDAWVLKSARQFAVRFLQLYASLQCYINLTASLNSDLGQFLGQFRASGTFLSCGTLKSTRMNTRFPATSTESILPSFEEISVTDKRETNLP